MERRTRRLASSAIKMDARQLEAGFCRCWHHDSWSINTACYERHVEVISQRQAPQHPSSAARNRRFVHGSHELLFFLRQHLKEFLSMKNQSDQRIMALDQSLDGRIRLFRIFIRSRPVSSLFMIG
jgi:hypothetical protein